MTGVPWTATPAAAVAAAYPATAPQTSGSSTAAPQDAFLWSAISKTRQLCVLSAPPAAQPALPSPSALTAHWETS